MRAAQYSATCISCLHSDAAEGWRAAARDHNPVCDLERGADQLHRGCGTGVAARSTMCRASGGNSNTRYRERQRCMHCMRCADRGSRHYMCRTRLEFTPCVMYVEAARFRLHPQILRPCQPHITLPPRREAATHETPSAGAWGERWHHGHRGQQLCRMRDAVSACESLPEAVNAAVTV